METDLELFESYQQNSIEIIDTLEFITDPTQFSSISNCVSLEKVFHMISENLTFDDPGIFLNKILPDPKCKKFQETFNMWLNNQIIYVYTHTDYDR